MVRKHINIVIASIWSIISIIMGLVFLKKNYEPSELYKGLIGKDQQIFWLIIAIAIAVLLIFSFITLIVKAIQNGRDSDECKILMFSLPFFIVLFSYFVASYIVSPYDHHYPGEDELYVLDAALNCFPYRFVYLSEMYLVSFMLIPSFLAPAIFKVVWVSLFMGYVVFRVKSYYNSNMAYCIYLLCLLKPFYALGTEIHRMQWYGFIYLFVMVKLCFDVMDKETKQYTWKDIASVIFFTALLSVLRREGMYLLVFGLILVLLAYAKKDKKANAIIIASFFVVELLFNIPIMINGMGEGRTAQNAIVVHILGEQSLDREKVSDELEVLGKVYDIEKIDLYNNIFGIEGFDNNQFDNPGFYDGVFYIEREDSDVSEVECKVAFSGLITKQPVAFIKSRLRAFVAAGRQQDSYNLYVPLMLLITELIYSIAHKRLSWIVMMLGVLAHIGLTTLAMPASLFKYYFEMWLIAYTWLVVMILDNNKNNLEEKHM